MRDQRNVKSGVHHTARPRPLPPSRLPTSPLQDPPLPWFMGDQRILNPDIRVGTAVEKLVGGNADLMVTLMTTFRYSRCVVRPGIGSCQVLGGRAAFAPRLGELARPNSHPCDHPPLQQVGRGAGVWSFQCLQGRGCAVPPGHDNDAGTFCPHASRSSWRGTRRRTPPAPPPDKTLPSPYPLQPPHPPRYLLLPTRDAIQLVLHQEAQPRDIVTAYLQVRQPSPPQARTRADPPSAAALLRHASALARGGRGGERGAGGGARAGAGGAGRGEWCCDPAAPAATPAGCITVRAHARTPPATPPAPRRRQACILRKRLKTGLPASSDNLPELRIILHDTML